jgi:protein-disulfide isomerase
MTSKAKNPDEHPRGAMPWPSRVIFPVGKTRRQRQQQYQQQMNMLVGIIAVTVIAAAVFVVANWRGAGSAKTVGCASYPQYCVPLAGGAAQFDALEAASARKLDRESEGVAGVVRYMDTNNIPTIGDPDAPIHFVTVSNFACSHCNDFHRGDVERFIKDYVLEGKATFGFAITTGLHPSSEIAALAALCAGEQGAFWEMSDELFRLARTEGVDSGFSLGSIRQSAEEMGLDQNKLEECTADGIYARVLDDHALFAADHGVTGTPTVFVSYGDSGEWTQVSRGYSNLAELTEAANAQTAQ